MSLNVKYEKKYYDIAAEHHQNGNRKLRCSPHLHHDIELVLLLKGKTVACADSARYELAPGDLFLAFPNQIHSFETLEKEDFYLFILKPELMPDFADTFSMKVPTSAVLRNAAAIPHLRELMDRVTELSANREADAYAKPLLRGYLLALFSEILRRMPLSGVEPEDSDALRSIISFCTRNYSHPLSLSELEENLHLNRYYISHLFSGKLGLGFNDYINSLRISEACRYLINSTHSITEISNLVGFNTLRTFNRAFIKQMGASPSEYRRENLHPKPARG